MASPRKLRACLSCGELTSGGSYCPAHAGRNGSTRAWRAVRARVLARDGHRCTAIVAGRRCPATTRLEIHHLIAVVDGGSDHPSNLVTVCHAHHPR